LIASIPRQPVQGPSHNLVRLAALQAGEHRVELGATPLA
jgi:hypothetical protein